MPDVTIRPVADADLPGVLAVQRACYGDALLEPPEALASRWTRSPALCLVATQGARVIGYLLSHAWHAWTPPKLHLPLPPDAPATAERFWFVHDMAIAPAGRGRRLENGSMPRLARRRERRDCTAPAWSRCKAPMRSGIGSAIVPQAPIPFNGRHCAPSTATMPN